MTRTVSCPRNASHGPARGIVASPVITLLLLAVSAPGCGKSRDSQASSDKSIPTATIPGKEGLAPGAKGQVPQARSRGDEHAVYSLADNRLSAHLHRGGGLVVLGGSAGFVKYMRFRKSDLSWKLREEREGKKVAIMDGKTGRVEVPLTADQVRGQAVLRMRVHNDKARALSLRINGKQDKEIGQQMAQGWSTLTIEVPAGLLTEGENELIFFTSAGQPMALEWLQIGGQAPQVSGDDAPRFYDRDRKSLILPRDGGLVYYVMVPESGLVTGDLNDATCKVAVKAAAEGGGTAEGELVGNGSAVELAKLAGKPVRLELTARDCETAYLANAALVVPGKAPTVKRADPPKHVVLWIMDSLRADRVKPFAASARPQVPTFERLAKEGAVFLQTYVQGNESRVSHASLWSALYPVKHDMIDAKAKLDGKWTILDEVMRAAGMYTSGVSANGYVARKWGFGDAWDHFSNHIHESLGLTGKDVLDKALATIQGKTDPWFLYIGTIDTHVSWRPKEPWIWSYHDRGYNGRFAQRFSGEDAGKGAKLNMTPAEIEWVRALYDSNVSYQDDLVKQLIEKLEEWGIADKTMIIITADHGDEQWEEGRVGHGASLRETLVHVPLVIHYPPMFPAGKISEGAEVLDVLPTIADVLGVKMDEEWQGESLLPLAQGVGAGYPRMSLASQYEGAHAARIGSWKLRAPGSGKPELYDMEREPTEKTDLADKSHIARRFVADPLWLLRAYNTDWRKPVFGNPANVKAAFPEHFGE